MSTRKRSRRKLTEKESEKRRATSAEEGVSSVIFEKGPEKNEGFTGEIHALPCWIRSDGPAKVSQYFFTEELQDGTQMATYRGRILNGVRQKLPEGYRLYVAVEKEKKDESRVFEVIGSAESFMRWEYHRRTSHQSSIDRAIKYLSIAEALAKDDD